MTLTKMTKATKMTLTIKKQIMKQKNYCSRTWLWQNKKKYCGDANNNNNAIDDDYNSSGNDNDSNSCIEYGHVTYQNDRLNE